MSGSPIRVVEISGRAAREIARARQWWFANRDKAPNAFDDDLVALVAELESHAEDVGAQQSGTSRRRVLLARIRYFVYFRIVEERNAVQVLAFWHASRGREPRLG